MKKIASNFPLLVSLTMNPRQFLQICFVCLILDPADQVREIPSLPTSTETIPSLSHLTLQHGCPKQKHTAAGHEVLKDLKLMKMIGQKEEI